VLDLQLLGRLLEADELKLVEALVVEASDVAHKPRLERGVWRRRCRSAAGHKAHCRKQRGNEGCQPKRQQSFLAQEMLPPPRDPAEMLEAMVLPAASGFS